MFSIYLRYVVVLLLLLPFCAHGQKAATADVKQLIAAIDTFATNMPAEKLYLHTDRPYYNNTDTIWIKAYVLDEALNASAQSGLLYAELVNDTGKVVLRQAMPVMFGLSWGQMLLDEKQVKEGAYTLRAYTNWMQNLGGQCFYTQLLYIGSPRETDWLVSSATKFTNGASKNNIETALRLTDQNGTPIRLRNIRLKLTGDNKTLLRATIQTDVDGVLRFNTNINEKANFARLTLLAEDDVAGSKQMVIPLHLAREENTDVQFFPEGGYLVAGLTSRVGFKSTAENGKGIPISGAIKDSKGQVVTRFKSNDIGIGSFELTPAAGEIYLAEVTLPSVVKNYPLPVTEPAGIVLRVNNIPGRDSLLLTVQAATPAANLFTLIGQSAGQVCFASAIRFTDGNHIINIKIAKSSFASGIARFTLFGNNRQPLAERMVFIDHNDLLKINIQTDKPAYKPTDSVTLQIQVTDKDDKPVTGNFSLAVTDDRQVKPDAFTTNIVSRMLLTADLKGHVENPNYYFDKPNQNAPADLDNLLLTQGWVGYSWKTVFDNAPPRYKAEKQMEITGRVTLISGKPLAGAPISLLSTNKPTLFMDTVTNKDGYFKFENFPRIDTAAFMLQLKSKKTGLFDARIHVDEFVPAAVTGLNYGQLTPWYVNGDTTLLNGNKQYMARQKQTDQIKNPGGGINLAEVVIKGKRRVKGSKFFDGAGVQPDQVFDEADMREAKKITLEQFLMKHVKGFAVKPFPCAGIPIRTDYMVYCGLALIAIDGVPIDQIYFPPPTPSMLDHYGFQQTFLQTFTAEDVRGIELHTTTSARASYTVIELTTWSGNGLYMKRVKGRYLYRPTPISWPKQFYNPKYAIQNAVQVISRPTIYWAPAISTDSMGKAVVTFNTGTAPGTYTLILQGSNISGNVGYQKQQIAIK